MSEEDQAWFEECYFADDVLFERLLSVEDELINGYVKGELNDIDRKRFEQHYAAYSLLPEKGRGDLASIMSASKKTGVTTGGTNTSNLNSRWKSLLSFLRFKRDQ